MDPLTHGQARQAAARPVWHASTSPDRYKQLLRRIRSGPASDRPGLTRC